MFKKITLKDEKILDDWSVLIENAQGKTEEIYQLIINFIKESRAPGVRVETVQVRPSWLKGIFGSIRKYLMVTNEESVKAYRFYVGARDYGNNLDVSWYLTCEPGFFSRIFIGKGKEAHGAIYTILDIFERQDLTAYVTCAHHCVLKAVEAIMQGLGQDFSKVDRKSRGFLGVS